MSNINLNEHFWAGPPLHVNSDLYHIYGPDERSLCGKYAHGSLNDKAPMSASDTWRDGKDCKACCRKAGLIE